MKHYMVIILSVCLWSCGDEKTESKTTLDENDNIIMKKESAALMENLVAEFEQCRDKSTQGMMDCRHYTAKALCDFYEIDDFRENGEFVNYHQMHDMIWDKMGRWIAIGPATSQEALKKAQDYANNNQATVAISDRDKYGHVAIILPGHLKPGKSWGLDVPNCASFFLVKGLKPFSNKPLNYAWRSNEDIILYTRNQD